MTDITKINENTFRFSDKCTDSFIEFEKHGDITWINSHYVDAKNCKLFMLLLKSSINYMQNEKCLKFQQIVLDSDWNNFLNKNIEWEIIDSFEETNEIPKTLLIECDIKFACELIIDGFLRNNE